MTASVVCVDAGSVDIFCQGMADRSPDRNVKLEDPSQAFLAEKLDMEPLTRGVGIVRKVSLKASAPIVETLNDKICHA